MGRKLMLLLGLVVCLLGLSGCVFGSVDEMYALPKSSEAYVKLQSKINETKGSAEYIAPLSGDNRQTIQLVDVDGDGTQEAVAFFRDTTQEDPLNIVIFKQDDQGEYKVYARIAGMGNEIESIDYLDLTEAKGRDILVSWQVSASVHTLVGYTLADGQPVEIMRSGYGRYLTADMDGDERSEVILAQSESSSASQWRIEYYDGKDGGMELVSSAPLSEGATDISAWTTGELKGGVPALFVTSYLGKDVLVADVFSMGEHGLKNIGLEEGERSSKNLFHYYAGVHPADINGDGLLEVPCEMRVAAYGDSSVDGFWWLKWKNYLPDGSSKTVMTTYHGGDGWYLEIPSAWTGVFSMNRQESSTTGVRSVTFARGVPDEESGKQPEPFLVIRSLAGGDRAALAQKEEGILLYEDSSVLYTGEILKSSWDCGLNEESLKAAFHVVGEKRTGK
ncbi:MAG: hypothetical protein SOR61_05680 [Evtepia sp.]|uniref:hypothetical protein n=1 Tax=Evtepia sp. TaxID=2773933 RepID=UPI002A755FBA|nr:hypothetical protein [Evtepia sp.]MDY3014667.1 hypothetical protein [Evtepia sp.]